MRYYKTTYKHTNNNEITINYSEIAATYQVRSSHGISILFCSRAGSSGGIKRRNFRKYV